jgi:hypothetical protein
MMTYLSYHHVKANTRTAYHKLTYKDLSCPECGNQLTTKLILDSLTLELFKDTITFQCFHLIPLFPLFSSPFIALPKNVG